MGGVISVFLVSCRSRRDKFYEGVAAEYHVREKKMRCGEPSWIPRMDLAEFLEKAEN